MAILSVTPIGISGGQPRAGTVSRDGGRTYTRHFRVITDGQGDGPKAIWQALPLSMGQSYHADGEGENGEADPASFVSNVSVAEEGEDGCSWIATVEYAPYNAEIQPVTPLDAQPKINWTWEVYQRVVRKDKDGNPVLNTAYDFFVPAVEVDERRPILQISRNESTFYPAFVDQYNGAINLSPWFGMAARKWKVIIGPANRTFNADIGYYWEVSYEFHLSRETDGWVEEVANMGKREIYTSGVDQSGIIKKKRHILDSTGEKITEAVALNADGSKKPVGQALEYLKFNVRTEVDFAVFGFDAFLVSLTGG